MMEGERERERERERSSISEMESLNLQHFCHGDERAVCEDALFHHQQLHFCMSACVHFCECVCLRVCQCRSVYDEMEAFEKSFE